MVSRDDGKLVVWPIYFDARASRPHRRVPKDLALERPTAEAVAKAAQALRLSPVLEKGRAHPAKWWRATGRVLVDIRGSKSVLLRQIAKKMREFERA